MKKLLLLPIFAISLVACKKKSENPAPAQQTQKAVITVTPQWKTLEKEWDPEYGIYFFRIKFLGKDGNKDIYNVRVCYTGTGSSGDIVVHERDDVSIDWTTGVPVSNYFIFQKHGNGWVKARPLLEQKNDYGNDGGHWSTY